MPLAEFRCACYFDQWNSVTKQDTCENIRLATKNRIHLLSLIFSVSAYSENDFLSPLTKCQGLTLFVLLLSKFS